MLRRVLKGAGVLAAMLLVAVVALAYTWLPGKVMTSMNHLHPAQPGELPGDAAELHRELFVVDLHCDATLWSRDVLAEDTRGHVDIPRLIAGNVALQGFTAATRIPRSMNIDRTENKWDVLVPLTFFQGWPANTWNSPHARALYQAGLLHKAATASGGRFRLIRTQEDLEAYEAARSKTPKIAAGFLGIEGLHCLEGDLEKVRVLFDAGYRMMAPTHFFDNLIGGSAHGVEKYGLTEFGAAVIEFMEALNITVDLAHASPKVIDDTLAMVTRPVVVSHTGVRGPCDNNRNLTDDQLRAIAATGGVIGIGFWDTAVCGDDVAAIVAAIRHTADVVGIDHVGLGSDWDGATVTPFDAAGTGQLTAGLLAAGFSEAEIRKVMGENVRRVLRANLPPAALIAAEVPLPAA